MTPLKIFRGYLFIILASVRFFRLVIVLFFFVVGFFNHVIKLTNIIEPIQINDPNLVIFLLI
jgi:hypothetical protein